RATVCRALRPPPPRRPRYGSAVRGSGSPVSRSLWNPPCPGTFCRRGARHDDRTTGMERLSPEDSRTLALESGAIVGHTCKVVIADRAGGTVEYLRDRIGRRIG